MHRSVVAVGQVSIRCVDVMYPISIGGCAEFSVLVKLAKSVLPEHWIYLG